MIPKIHKTKPINRKKIAGARTNPPSAMVNDVHRRPLPITTKIIPIIIMIMLTLFFSIYLSPLLIRYHDIGLNSYFLFK